MVSTQGILDGAEVRSRAYPLLVELVRRSPYPSEVEYRNIALQYAGVSTMQEFKELYGEARWSTLLTQVCMYSCNQNAIPQSLMLCTTVLSDAPLHQVFFEAIAECMCMPQ
jgi:hypothetical protein